MAYEPGQVHLTMDGFIHKVLKNHRLSDCNPPKTPLLPGFRLSKADAPATDEERAAAVAFTNKAFGTLFQRYDDVRTYYQGGVAEIGWYAMQVGPGLKHTVSTLSRANHYPGGKAIQALKHGLKYLKAELGVGIVYSCVVPLAPTAFPEMVIESDASFADCDDTGKTQGGHVHRFRNMAVHASVSSRSTTICTSTTHAETYWASEACRHIKYEVMLYHELGLSVPLPVELRIDNAATVNEAGAPIRKFSARTKHFTIAEKFVHQCNEEGLIRIVKWPGTDLSADAMTKSLVAPTYNRHKFALTRGCP
jgi:hypothetical protein